MDDDQHRLDFEKLLRERLVPEFCSDAGRSMHPSGFKRSPEKLSAVDCRYFLLAWTTGLIQHIGRGQYNAPLSAAREQFFNSGPRATKDRIFFLAFESVITVGGLARLHFDHRWPRHLLGAQSKGYAFDLAAHVDPLGPMHIACEVKKTNAEIDTLIRHMCELGRQPNANVPSNDRRRNAFKKVTALRRDRPPIFWALGPGGQGQAFAVHYDGDMIEFRSGSKAMLTFPNTTLCT